jgi:hypothetical protein
MSSAKLHPLTNLPVLLGRNHKFRCGRSHEAQQTCQSNLQTMVKFCGRAESSERTIEPRPHSHTGAMLIYYDHNILDDRDNTLPAALNAKDFLSVFSKSHNNRLLFHCICISAGVLYCFHSLAGASFGFLGS